MAQTQRSKGPLTSRPSLGNAQTFAREFRNTKPPPSTTTADHITDFSASINGFSDTIRTTDDFGRTMRPSTSNLDSSMYEDPEHSVDVGDAVEVPGGMLGVVRYVGGVKGKHGIFAGVELSKEFAPRGKNDGDVDGMRYFTPDIPGSGIFLPAHRAIRIASPDISAFPQTPTAASSRAAAPASRTPPTPSLPKLSQSVGPGGRHPFSSSVGPGAKVATPAKLKSRSSIARAESPFAKPPVLQPTPGGRTSNVGFSQSVRASSRPIAPPSPVPVRAGLAKPRTPAPVARPPSRASSRAGSRLQELSADDEGSTVASRARASVGTARSPTRPSTTAGASSVEVRRLQNELDERDLQLKEQAASLAAMEVSFAELQASLAIQQVGTPSPEATSNNRDMTLDDTASLRMQLADKNEKLAALTAEFDAHRADFRSTIDTLELASTETERVYERRVEDLMAQVAALQERGDEVDSVAIQLKQLEELVAELEDGLEDARRGEQEARSEVEFLRGEVERARQELGAERANRKSVGGEAAAAQAQAQLTKELEARNDEIRGLKAIMHGLTSESEADKGMNGEDKESEEMARLRDEMVELLRDKSELQELVEAKALREEELEEELERLRPRHRDDDDDDNNDADHDDAPHSNTTHKNPGATRRSPNGHSAAAADTHESSSSKSAHYDTPDEEAAPPPVSTAGGASDPVYDPSGTGPAPGKASRRIDMTRWCALCERDGHESVDCPFEEEY